MAKHWAIKQTGEDAKDAVATGKWLDSLFQNSKDPIVFADINGNLQAVNRAFEDLTGYSRDELAEKKTFMDITPKKYTDFEARLVRRVIETGVSAEFEKEYIRKDGSCVPILLNAFVVKNEADELIGSGAILKDLTERKKSEEEKETLLHNIGQRVKELNCLYTIAKIAAAPNIPLGEVCQKTAEIIPPSWQHPEITCARIIVHDQEYKTANFKKTKWLQAADIIENGNKAGTVEVYYLEESPVIYEGPFLKEERDLIEGIAERLGKSTERQRADELSDALNEINNGINATLDFDQIMQNVIVIAARAIQSETAVIAVREEAYWVLKYVYGSSQDLVGTKFTDQQSPHVVMATKNKVTVAIDDAYEDDRVDPQVMKKYGVRSALVVPLSTKEEIIGALVFNYHSKKNVFSPLQIDFANKLGTSLSMALENARLYSAQRDIANTLQETFLTVPEEIKGIDFGHLYNASTEVAKVGGDFFDLIELEENQVGIFIGDVSGKGLEAAKMTSMIKNTIHAHAHEEDSPARILKKVNKSACRTFPSGLFATVFLGILDTTTGILTYCNGGHPPPIIKRTGTRSSSLTTGNMPIGALEEVDYDDRKAKLRNGDILFAYTDGLIEARRGTRFYGEKRLRKAVKELASIPARELPQIIFDKVAAFSNGKLADDVAILAVSLKRKGESN